MATQAEIAAHLFLSDRSVRDLVAKGILPAARKGALDVDDCRRRYLEHLRMVAAGRARDPAGDIADGDALDLEAERAGLARAQREGHELRNAATRLELLPRDAITRAVTAAFAHVRDRLSALPSRLAGPLARATEPAETRATLARAVDEVLKELSETRIVAAGEEVARAA